ncbi:hypothetical protein [Effusibacillus consociatus]|uniref:Uncharacterized protein n=1 Tax=Effusibacillus consociatus TaxID=1117041 RepID=A0ABV9PWL2_9BACL
MDCYLMDPPFGVKPFVQMSKKEADIHFAWYISEIPKRLQLLKDAFEFTGGGKKEVLNLTPESLKPLWEWFIPQVTIVQQSQEELEAELRNAPEWLREAQKTEKISKEALTIAMDIAVYFAEVFITHNESVSWDIVRKPKSDADFNQPVLFGFGEDVLNPRRVLHTLTLRAARGETTADALYDMYKVWENYLP